MKRNAKAAAPEQLPALERSGQSLERRFGNRSTELREYRNTRLYRSLARILREYNRRLVVELRARGFADFSPAFPQILSNLDTEGTRIGVLAQRAGVTRQAAGKLLIEIERAGYVERLPDAEDARATLVLFTPRGRRLLGTVIELVEAIEGEFEHSLGRASFDQVRAGLFQIAEGFDPLGRLGTRDREPR
ncbi:MAG: MarR family transcriptional regulator [Deltaproteobacteria bacterium]